MTQVQVQNQKSEITLKEVYERIISLEAKYDVSLEDDDIRTKRFTMYVFLLSMLIILDIVLSLASLLLLM